MAPRDAIRSLQAAMNAEVLGQPTVVERMVIGLLADGQRSLYRALRRAIRSGPYAGIRPRFSAWRASLPAPGATAAVEDAFRALDRLRYGPEPSGASEAAARRRLLAAMAAMRASAAAPAATPLLPLNP